MAADSRPPQYKGPTSSDYDILSRDESELIAEVCDGLLTGDALDEALRRIHASPAALEMYLEATAMLGGVALVPTPVPTPDRVVSGPTPVGPPRQLRRRFDQLVAAFTSAPAWQKVLPLAAAASLAVLLMLPGGSSYAPALAASLSPAAIVATLDAPHPLPVSRGGTSVPATDLGRAFRLGVRVLDAEAALLADRTDDARMYSELILTLLDDLDAPLTVVVGFRGLLQTVAANDRARIDESVESWLEEEGVAMLARYRFGKGTETVRFATASDDIGSVRSAARQLEATGTGLSAETSRQVDELVASLQQSQLDPQDQARILELLEAVMDAASR